MGKCITEKCIAGLGQLIYQNKYLKYSRREQIEKILNNILIECPLDEKAKMELQKFINNIKEGPWTTTLKYGLNNDLTDTIIWIISLIQRSL